MGVLLILLGILLAGAVVDVAVENDIATAATQPLTVASTSVQVSTPMVAAISFGLGVLAVLLIVAGVRRLRRARRLTMQARIERLEEENARLATRQNLPNVVRIPEAEPERPPTPAAPTEEQSPSTRW
jgi:uncharacterized membrane protein YciS (DUF1049 family)